MNGKEEKRELSPREKAFCVEYIKNHAAAAKAYVLAGYAKKGARANAARLKARPEIQAYIAELAAAEDKKAVADTDEVMRYLTAVMRGTHESSVLVTVGIGKGKTQAMSVSKKPEERDQLEAAKTLAKIFGILTNKVDVKGGLKVVQIIDDVPEGGDLTGEDPSSYTDGESDD